MEEGQNEKREVFNVKNPLSYHPLPSLALQNAKRG